MNVCFEVDLPADTRSGEDDDGEERTELQACKDEITREERIEDQKAKKETKCAAVQSNLRYSFGILRWRSDGATDFGGHRFTTGDR